MPIYEYACGKCQHEFEVEQRMTDEPIKTCPKCRSRKVKKLISKTSFVLKGGGWYSDLYSSAKKGDDKAEAKAESPSSDSPGASASKSETGASTDTSKDTSKDKKDAKKSDAKGRKGKSKAA